MGPVVQNSGASMPIIIGKVNNRTYSEHRASKSFVGGGSLSCPSHRFLNGRDERGSMFAGREGWQGYVCRSKRMTPVRMALLDPPDFDPRKLQVSYLRGAGGDWGPEDLPTCKRRYTLTHNDLTGSLNLSIGDEYNHQQLSGWYTRILRDEVLAEWHLERKVDAGLQVGGDRRLKSRLGMGDGRNTIVEECVAVSIEDAIAVDSGRVGLKASLHVYCHVSGEESWPAPPGLRSFIFQREMRLVLDTISYADRELLQSSQCLAEALVYVHLVSDIEPLNQVVMWGQLGDKSTWQRLRKGSLLRLLAFGFSEDSRVVAPQGDTSRVTGGGAEEHVHGRLEWLDGPPRQNKVALGGVPSIVPANLSRPNTDQRIK